MSLSIRATNAAVRMVLPWASKPPVANVLCLIAIVLNRPVGLTFTNNVSDHWGVDLIQCFLNILFALQTILVIDLRFFRRCNRLINLYAVGRLMEQLLAPLRRLFPSFGGIDLSAIVLIIALQIGLIVLA